MALTSFTQIREIAEKHGPVRIAVAGGDSETVCTTIVKAIESGLVCYAIVTVKHASAYVHAANNACRGKMTLVSADDDQMCAQLAVRSVRTGEAQILVKGHVDSRTYLKAIVDKQDGIRGTGTLSNVTVAEMSSYPKLLAATDNGIIPEPDLDQKRAIVANAVGLFKHLGYHTVRVAAVSASEKPSSSVAGSIDFAQMAESYRANCSAGLSFDGPFGYDVAVSKKAALIKNLGASEVAGNADVLLFPNITSANSIVKAWKLHGNAQTASLVLGAQVPVVLNSRSDGPDKRILAITLAAATWKRQSNADLRV